MKEEEESLSLYSNMEPTKGNQMELKYLGIRRQPKYETPTKMGPAFARHFRDCRASRQGLRPPGPPRDSQFSEYDLRGHLAILNFPNDGQYRDPGPAMPSMVIANN
ncbi:integrase-type DNA-binding superfamily protein [Striga asiatica]|uniref:Integrase-type DNA-binding superfamily protein n=1 Tax=Striga asiatica TaxID=4170 RepID=A0A5A7PAV9_STRAF|nr:integrase-type DNA-binding superfamily protein [Striga asiatica]